MEERDWSPFACPNPKCSLFNLADQGNLRPHGWSSKPRNIRCLRCTRCGKNFSERKGTPFYRTQLPEDRLIAIAEHIVEGDGMRATSRLCHVPLNTVLRFAHRAGDHAQGFHDQMVRHVQVKQVQADEAWAFVGKKDKHCNPTDPADRTHGSQWDHVLLDVPSRLIVSLVVGRRTKETLQQAFSDFYERTDGGLPALITTDEYAAYFSVIVSTWGVPKENLEMTDEQKEQYDWDEMPAVYFPVEISYATVHKERQQGRVVKVEQRVIFGSPEQVVAALQESSTAKTINTSYIERWNGTQRHFNARKKRKAYTFSKDIVFHVAVTWLCVASYNFCWQPWTLREKVQDEPPRYRHRTPAMAAGLAKEAWTLSQVLSHPIYVLPAKQNHRKRRRGKRLKTDGG